MSAQSVEGATDSGDQARPAARWSPSRLAVTLLAAGLVVVVVRALFVQTFVIPSGSMEPGLQVGDRVVVSRLDYRFGAIQRGDVVVFDGEGVFTPPRQPGSVLAEAGRTVAGALGAPVAESDFVKRVVGLGGDRVVCCDENGRITVNGRPVEEPYVYPGDDPSDVPFDVKVPPGRLWVLGDHRSSSADSREHLGDPGAGMVPVDRVVGRVVAVWWPWSRATGVGRASAEPGVTPRVSVSAPRTDTATGPSALHERPPE